MLNDKTIGVYYLGYGLEPSREPEEHEEIICVPKDGQAVEEAAKEMLQDVMAIHLEGGLPGPVRFGKLVSLFTEALKAVELEPVDSSDRGHWFVLRWEERTN